MAVLRNPESEETKERARWEQHPSEWTIGGLRPGNPYVYRPFPKMLYKAAQLPNGKWSTAMDPPTYHGFRDQDEWGRACQAAENFTRSCQRVVNDEREYERALEEGWRVGPNGAMEYRAALDKAVSDAAAERNFRDRNMSEKAKAESAEVEAQHFGHLPEIPEKPRRGRPPKNRPAA